MYSPFLDNLDGNQTSEHASYKPSTLLQPGDTISTLTKYLLVIFNKQIYIICYYMLLYLHINNFFFLHYFKSKHLSQQTLIIIVDQQMT